MSFPSAAANAITATRPTLPPFFPSRRSGRANLISRQLRARFLPTGDGSSAGSTSSTNDNSNSSDESDEDEDSESEIESDAEFDQLPGGLREIARMVRTEESALNREGGGGGGSASTSSSLSRLDSSGSRATPHLTSSPRLSTPATSAQMKLSIAILRVRQTISILSYTSTIHDDYAQLATALKSLSTLLPTRIDEGLGTFLPILDRLGDSVRDVLWRRHGRNQKGLDDASEENEEDEEVVERAYRKGLSKESAKALIALRQRWTRGGTANRANTGKSIGKMREGEGERDWVGDVRGIVAQRPPPQVLQDASKDSTANASLLNSFESLLLSSTLPRISLSNLNLTDIALRRWQLLEQASEVLMWYLTFERTIETVEERMQRAKSLLNDVRSLDLARNSLSTIPLYLARLFPLLESLSIAHNSFSHLPHSIIYFAHLRGLKTHGNSLGRTRGAKRSNVKEIKSLWKHRPRNVVMSRGSLLECCVQQIQGTLRRASTNATPFDSLSLAISALPPHLQRLIHASYTCASCYHFIRSDSATEWTPPLFERIHFLDPGIPIAPLLSSTSSTLSGRSGDGNRTTMTTGRRRRSIGDDAPHLLSLEDKIILALLSRGVNLTTYILASDAEEGVRLCLECVGRHLQFEDDDSVCNCGVCEEGRKVQEGTGRERVVRWLRRKNGI